MILYTINIKIKDNKLTEFQPLTENIDINSYVKNKLAHNKIWLAPLAGYTDAPFRFIAKKCGADVLVSEMVSADGVKRNFEKMAHYTRFEEFERPFGIQLFGDNPNVMAKASEILSKLKPDFFDINMGCPVKKVVKRYAGSALMLKPDLACEIIKQVSSVLDNLNIPLTVKIRSGWDDDNINAIDFAQMAEQAGAKLLIIHPRTRKQHFSGHSNWDIIKQIKQVLSIPVIGNGDIYTPEDAIQMLNETKCDGIMIGRGALGKPWIFQEIKDYLSNNNNSNCIKHLDPNEKLKYILEHIDRVLHNTQDTKVLIPMRAHFAFYTKGFANGSKAREIIFKSINPDEIKNTLRDLFNGKL